MALDVEFEDDHIRFVDYPYPPASVAGGGVISVDAIRAVDAMTAPPEVRLISGEILFVSAVYRDALQAFVTQNAIIAERRIDVWALILEPFLDTEFDEAWQAKTYATLDACGIDRATVDALRARFTPAMIAYNFESMLWEWVHLGLSDLLDALRGGLAGPQHRLSDEEFAAFYWEAMDLANRGSVRA